MKVEIVFKRYNPLLKNRYGLSIPKYGNGLILLIEWIERETRNNRVIEKIRIEDDSIIVFLNIPDAQLILVSDYINANL